MAYAPIVIPELLDKYILMTFNQKQHDILIVPLLAVDSVIFSYLCFIVQYYFKFLFLRYKIYNSENLNYYPIIVLFNVHILIM